MEEQQTEKSEFSESIDKITESLNLKIEDLEEEDVKYARTKLNEIDKIYKQKYKKPKSETIKNFISALRDKIPEKEKVIETLKKIKKVRIVIKED